MSMQIDDLTDDERALYWIQALIIEAYKDEPEYLSEVVRLSRWFEAFPEQRRLAELA